MSFQVYKSLQQHPLSFITSPLQVIQIPRVFLPSHCNMMELKGAKLNILNSFSLTHELMHSWDIRFEIYLQFYIFYNIEFIFTATE